MYAKRWFIISALGTRSCLAACYVEDWCLPAIKTEPLTSAGQTIPYLRHRSWSCGVGRWVRAPWSLRWSRQEQEWDIQWWMSGKSTNDNFCAGILRHNIEMCTLCTLRFPIWNRLLWILYHLNPLPHYHLYHQIQQSTTNYGSTTPNNAKFPRAY